MLQVARWRVDVEPSLLALASQRCRLERFGAPPGGAPLLRMQRIPELPPDRSVPLDGEPSGRARYRVEGDTLLAAIPDEPRASEAALRALFQLAFLRQGALLLHGAGICWGGRALVATGPSGAGKSTLARLCRGAGAALLSDESVALSPEGKVFATPFQSDADLIGDALEADLAGIAILEKGAEERLAPVPPDRAVAHLLSQAYRPPPGAIARPELLARAASLAARPGVHQLTFRKDPEVGHFVARWLGADVRA